MIIYGVGLLSVCLIVGLVLGELLGSLIGVKANVGGVGIAMLMLIILHHYSGKKFQLNSVSSQGITFWSAMYIPIIVAMAAKQNVIAAISSGPVALLAGTLAVVASYSLIPLMSRKMSAPTAEGQDETS